MTGTAPSRAENKILKIIILIIEFMMVYVDGRKPLSIAGIIRALRAKERKWFSSDVE